MFENFESAEKFTRDHEVRMIDLKFTDLWGRWHHVTLSALEFKPKLMKEGVGFDGSSVGLKSVKSGDMALIPDLATGFIDPFCEVNTLSFLCNTVEADTKQVFTRDPRQIAKRTEQYLIDSGIADKSLWGPEFEFYIFRSAFFHNSINNSSYQFESDEAFWNNQTGGSGDYIPQHGGYHSIPPRDKHFNLRTRIVTALETAHIPVKYHHHEVGGPGQCEIETPMLEFIKAADSAMMIKYFVKMITLKVDRQLHFCQNRCMANPVAECTSTSSYS